MPGIQEVEQAGLHLKVHTKSGGKAVPQIINMVAQCCEIREINVREPNDIVPLIQNAGSVFLGPFAPVTAGDYASGTNHTLPTGGTARWFNGVSLESFQKSITFQSITRDGLKRLAPALTTLAGVEGLEAHARAVTIRFDN